MALNKLAAAWIQRKLQYRLVVITSLSSLTNTNIMENMDSFLNDVQILVEVWRHSTLTMRNMLKFLHLNSKYET
jgi:hypothetical protein